MPNGHQGSFPGIKWLENKLTTQLYLVPNLRMSAAMLLLPLYALMVSTGTTLPLPLPLHASTNAVIV
jgi:hypothetical protein